MTRAAPGVARELRKHVAILERESLNWSGPDALNVAAKTQAAAIAERCVNGPCSLPPNKIIGSQLGAPVTKRKP